MSITWTQSDEDASMHLSSRDGEAHVGAWGRQLESCLLHCCNSSMESPLQASVAAVADFSICSQELLFAMLPFQEPAKISLIAPFPGVQDMWPNTGKEAESQQAPTSERKYFICQGYVTVQLNNCAACCQYTLFVGYQLTHHAMSLPITNFSFKSCLQRLMLFVAKACSMQTISVCYQFTRPNYWCPWGITLANK